MKNNKLNERSNKNHDREHAHWDRRGFLKTLCESISSKKQFDSDTKSSNWLDTEDKL